MCLALHIHNISHGNLQISHPDFDRKLIGGKSLCWILANDSNTMAAPAGRQSYNVLAEHTWSTLIQIPREFITENQVGR